MSEEKIWVVKRPGQGIERIRAAKVHFIGDGYNSARALKLVTKGQVKAVYAASAWSSVHLEGAEEEAK